MLINPYIAVFALGGFIALAAKPLPAWEGVAIGLLCVVACGVAKLLWKPTPPPKKLSREAGRDVAVQDELTMGGSAPFEGLPSGTIPGTPHPALFASVPTQVQGR